MTPPLQYSKLDEFNRLSEGMDGWFYAYAAALWDTLLAAQSRTHIVGNFMEFGVWKGKSALMMALHARPDESCTLVDPMPLTEAQAAIAPIKSERVHYVQMRSCDLLPTGNLNPNSRNLRWAHIDGEHTGHAVYEELTLLNPLLADQGVLVVDDFMSACYPQITRAVFAYLEAHPFELTMFLCGFNKAYLCRPRDARKYLAYLHAHLGDEMAARDLPVCLYKTTEPTDMNCFGVIQQGDGPSLVGPDWDKQRIEY